MPYPVLSSAFFSKGHWQCHMAIRQLTEELDMEHSCGFVTLLNPHQSPVTEEDADATSPQQQISASASISASESVSNEDVSGNPANGIKDKVSAEMLASELDALDGEPQSVKRDGMSLDLKPEAVSEVGGQGDAQIESHWHLLDLCFGIPLFDPQLNKEVCQKIVSLRLFKEERYDPLLIFFLGGVWG